MNGIALDSNIRNSRLALFKKCILAFSRTSQNSIFYCPKPVGLKLIKKLRLGSSDLGFQNLKFIFQNTLNCVCNCGTVDITIHYLLNCHNLSNKRKTLFNKLRSTDESILSKNDSNVLKVFAYGEHSFNNVKITFIIIAAIECSIQTKHFNAPLYQNWYLPICL